MVIANAGTIPVYDYAEDIGIEDAGSYYTGTEVETALQELGAGTVVTETDPIASIINGILKSDGTTLSAAVAGTDYQAAITGADTYVLFFDGANNPAGDSGLIYNKTTDTLTAAIFVGALTGNADTVTNGVYTTDFPLNQDTTGKADTAGNADTVTTNANLTGEVTSTGNAAVLDPTCISGKADTTIADTDYVLFWDVTDSTLKKVDGAELTAGEANEYSFKTITGITNDVVADTTTDTLTFTGAGIVGIEGTTATDTITITGTEADTLATVTGRGATTATASTFSGGITATLTGSSTSCTGEAATVATITGLAPDTQNTYARTQYLIPYASTTTAFGEIAIGTDGQVLTSAGAGVAPAFEDAAAGGGGAFTLDTGVVREDVSGAGAYATDDFVFGSPTLADDANADHDSRMFFDKSKYAFRAGSVTGTDWNTPGSGSAAFGTNCLATGSASFAAGASSDATGAYAFAMGESAIASGSRSFSVGSQTTASGTYAIAMGRYSNAYLLSQFAHSAGRWSGYSGSAQYSRVILRSDTTNETPEVMKIDNNSRVILPASTAWRVDAYIIATTEDCALSSSWTVNGVIHRDAANNTEVIWSSVTEDVDEIDTVAAVTMTADDTYEALSINITGKSATNIRWAATVHLTEVIY